MPTIQHNQAFNHHEMCVRISSSYAVSLSSEGIWKIPVVKIAISLMYEFPFIRSFDGVSKYISK